MMRKQSTHKEVLEGRLVRDHPLYEHARNSDHGETPVLDLVELVPFFRLRVVSDVEGVEPKVSRLAATVFLCLVDWAPRRICIVSAHNAQVGLGREAGADGGGSWGGGRGVRCFGMIPKTSV